MRDTSAPPSVVVVDDELAVLDLLHDVLEDDGISSLCLQQGAKAQQLISEHQPQVVILDVQMPAVDGIEVFTRLRQDPATAEIPVIFLTANVHILRNRLPNFPSMHATVLPKPFNVVALLSQVYRHLPHAA